MLVRQVEKKILLTFMNRITNIGIGNNVHFTVYDVINAIDKQKG